jgi:quercetin dioxygenase-like cupin family protein
MKRLAMLFYTAVALALLAPLPAFAQSVEATTVLERRIPADDAPSGAQLFQAVLDFEPGAWTPLHSHNGSSYNTVLGGELILRQDGLDRTFTAGQGWVDQPGVLHAAGNQSGALARLIASFVVRPGLPPSTIVAPDPGAIVPPTPTTVALFKLNAPELAQPLEVVHQLIDLGPGATIPLATEPGPRIISVLDGSVATVQDGQPQDAAVGDSWAEPDASALGLTAGEAGAQVVTTTFLPRGAPVGAAAPQVVEAAVQLAGR